MAEKPTGAAVLSIIGGVFILLAGLVLMAIGAWLDFLLGVTGLTFGLPVTTLGILGLVLGLVIIVLGVMLLMKPEMHLVFGVLILVLSLVSVISLGGFFIGLILGLVGGILGIVFKPTPPMMAAPMPPPPQ